MPAFRQSLTSARSMQATDWILEADPFGGRDLPLKMSSSAQGTAVCEGQRRWNRKKTECTMRQRGNPRRW